MYPTVSSNLTTRNLYADDIAGRTKLYPAVAPPGWISLNGQMISDPAVVSEEPNRVDVFILGTDGALYQKWRAGGEWALLSPTTSTWGPKRVDVFCVGLDKALYHKWWGWK